MKIMIDNKIKTKNNYTNSFLLFFHINGSVEGPAYQ